MFNREAASPDGVLLREVAGDEDALTAGLLNHLLGFLFRRTQK
jgi:hypothetical protein